jgi:hypothetical protein
MLLIYISITDENLRQKGLFLVPLSLKTYISIICLVPSMAKVVLQVSISWKPCSILQD